MKQPIKILFACVAAVALGSAFAAPTNAPQPTQEAVELAKLIGEIEVQQTQLLSNQDALEKRITGIAEELRMAKIMASRAK